MRIRLIVILLCLIGVQDVLYSQSVLGVFRNDSKFNEFLIEDVDSISFSKFDLDSAKNDRYVVQDVYTKNGIYRMPLNVIDSISFQQDLSNSFSIEDESLGDWDEGYVYQSSNESENTVFCTIKTIVDDDMVVYLGNFDDIYNPDNGIVFVLDKNGNLKQFFHDNIIYSVSYDINNIVFEGLDTLGNRTQKYYIEIDGETSMARKTISWDALNKGFKTIKLVLDVLNLTNLADNGEWGKLFFSIFKNGASKVLKLNAFLQTLEIMDKIACLQMTSQIYVDCQSDVKRVDKISSNTAKVSIDILNASSLSYEYNIYWYNDYTHESGKITTPVNKYFAGVVVKEGSLYVSYSDYDQRPSIQAIDRSSGNVEFTLSDLKVGHKYYIRPYIMSDIQLQEGKWMRPGEIRYGGTYEYVFNGVTTEFEQTSCTYLGNNQMGVSFNLSAEIASLDDVSGWGVMIKGKDNEVIDTYYAANGSKTIDLYKEMMVKKSLFNSDNIANISICPFYIYGYYATPVYLESSEEHFKWELKLETRGHSRIDDTSEEVSLYTEGFDMNGAPNDCTVGFLYGKSKNLSLGNCDVAISNNKSGGDISVTLRELEKNTTYYYKAYVQIEGIYYYGEETKEFTTGEILCPDSNHPHMIDLGIGTKWACCNVGAHSPEEYGGYYAWGEVSEKDYYAPHTYQYAYQDNDGNWWDNDTQSSYSCRSLGSDISGTGYDVAHVQWGGSWCMPTLDEIKALVNNCSSVWTTENGVDGHRFTGPNGGSIFLPAAGYRWYGDLYRAGEYGYYWSSTQSPEFSSYAYGLLFRSGRARWYDGSRYDGKSVRPVVRN